MEILFVLMGIFIVCLFVFFALAVFLPEWLGITGKKAQEIMRHQQSDESQDPNAKSEALEPSSKEPRQP